MHLEKNTTDNYDFFDDLFFQKTFRIRYMTTESTKLQNKYPLQSLQENDNPLFYIVTFNNVKYQHNDKQNICYTSYDIKSHQDSYSKIDNEWTYDYKLEFEESYERDYILQEQMYKEDYYDSY